MVSSFKTYAKNEATSWPVPNYWDLLALFLVLGWIMLLAWGAHSMLGRFHIGDSVTISANPVHLPYYALLTVLRMLVALFFSLVFTFVFGAWAAKSSRAERVIIPLIDILQSVPVLGFLSMTVVGFMVLFRGSLLGPECAAIFAIFAAQAWNMTLSFYQSLKMVPHDMQEASAIFQLSVWQKFWLVEVPFATPSLVWNIMLSMSSSWIFLVAAEAISIANHRLFLPGMGSYIALAIMNKNVAGIVYVIITMIVVIFLVDQLLFRPLLAWSEKFKMHRVGTDESLSTSWVLQLFQRTRLLRYLGLGLGVVGHAIINMPLFRRRQRRFMSSTDSRRVLHFLWFVLLMGPIFLAVVTLYRFIFTSVSLSEVESVFFMGLATAARVVVAILVSSLIWVPIGVCIGLSPRATRITQPIVQFLAAFPTNLIFPIAVWGILRFHLNVNIWVTPLMILGAQWYILFNVIAGTVALPQDLHDAVGTLGVRGWLWWRSFILPGVFPCYITGAITAAGAAWNVSIITEALSWGTTHLWATGLGAYIVQVSHAGDFPRLALGIVTMSLYVVALNRMVWRPLYNLAESRFQLK